MQSLLKFAMNVCSAVIEKVLLRETKSLKSLFSVFPRTPVRKRAESPTPRGPDGGNQPRVQNLGTFQWRSKSTYRMFIETDISKQPFKVLPEPTVYSL